MVQNNLFSQSGGQKSQIKVVLKLASEGARTVRSVPLTLWPCRQPLVLLGLYTASLQSTTMVTWHSFSPVSLVLLRRTLDQGLP